MKKADSLPNLPIMPLDQALSLAGLVLQWEAENARAARVKDWAEECAAAALALAEHYPAERPPWLASDPALIMRSNFPPALPARRR